MSSTKKPSSQKRAANEQQDNRTLNRIYYVFLLGLAAECYLILAYRGFAFGNIGSTLAWNKFLNVAMWVGLALLAAGAGAAVWKKKDRKLRTIENQNTTIESQNTKIENQNATIESQNVKIENQNATIESQNVMIEKQNATIENQNVMIEKQNAVIKDQNKRIKWLEEKILSLQEEADSLKKLLSEHIM